MRETVASGNDTSGGNTVAANMHVLVRLVNI